MNKLLTLFVSAAAIAMCSCSDDKLTGDVPYQPENPDNGQSVQRSSHSSHLDVSN